MTIRELVTMLGFRLNDAPLREYERRVEGAKKKSEALTNAVGGIGKAVKLIGGAVAAAGIAAIGKSILDTTGEVEQYRVTLGTMIGDQEKANKIIHDLDYSPVSDFYGTAAAIGGLQGMVTFGMQAEEASETLTRLGDIAQGNGEAFKSLSLNMGQVFAKGKADATDLKQFVGQGFDVVGEVSKATGKSRAEVEKAGVTYEQCAMALKNITSEGGKYNGMLEKQSKTLPGLIKQFQSLSAAIQESIGTGILDKVKDLLQYFLNLGRAMQDNIAKVGTKAFEAVLRGIAQVIIFMEVLQMRMKKFGGAFTPIKALAKDVFGFVGSVLRSLFPLLMSVSQAALLAFKPIQAFVSPILEALKPIFKDVFQFGADMVSTLLPVIDALTPVFKKAGDVIAGAFEKIRPVFRKVENAILKVFNAIIAFVQPVIAALNPLSDVVSVLFDAIIGGVDQAASETSVFVKIIGGLTPIFSVLGKIVGGIITILASGLSTILPVLQPIVKVLVVLASIIGGIIAALKIWSAVQTVLNVIMAANPIGLIILAVVALIGVITLLVKNWDAVKNALINGAKAVGNFFVGMWQAVKNAFINAFSAIGNFFSGLWNAIKNACISGVNAIVNFFVKIVTSIKNFFAGLQKYAKGMLRILTAIIAPVPMLVIGAILLIKKNWDKIKAALIKGGKAVGDFFKKIWTAIKNTAVAAFVKLKAAVLNVLNGIKAAWETIKGFFAGLWESIVAVAQTVWNGFVNIFSPVIERIKAVWNTITDFFAGFWNGIVSVTSSIWSGIVGVFSAVIEQIKAVWNGITDFFSCLWDSLKGAVAGVAESIRNTFFSLFDGIKKKFFGFIDTIKNGWESVKGFFSGLWDGAVNLFTGGSDSDEATPTKVNDLIVTPDGTFSTHPEDTIFAMKDPGVLVDRLAALLSGGFSQPSYALAGNSAAQAVRQSISNDYSRHSSSQTFNTPINVSVNASGMSVEQARRAVEVGVRGALRDAIAGSRGVIPSPEARRA